MKLDKPRQRENKCKRWCKIQSPTHLFTQESHINTKLETTIIISLLNDAFIFIFLLSVQIWRHCLYLHWFVFPEIFIICLDSLNFYFSNCVRICGYVHKFIQVPVESRIGDRCFGSAVIGSCELPIWMLGTELGSYARAIWALNCWGISVAFPI